MNGHPPAPSRETKTKSSAFYKGFMETRCLSSGRASGTVLSVVFNEYSSRIMHNRPQAGWDLLCSSPKRKACHLALVQGARETRVMF